MVSTRHVLRKNWRITTALYSSIVALSVLGCAAPGRADDTASPIKHLIVLIGENRGLDHTFGTYTPVGKNQTISNLLSKGIVDAYGNPGPNFSTVPQYSVATQPNWYFGAPNNAKTAYTNSYGVPLNLQPQPNTNGAPSAQSTTGAPFVSVGAVEATGEADIEDEDLNLLTTGATGLANDIPDTRIPNLNNIVGPFMLLGPLISDDDYTGDMTHRFYQAAQQQDCSLANVDKKNNPSGCLNDLFPFVMDTYDRTASAQKNFSEGNEMGFYNMAQGEVSLLKQLADRFTLVDNFHQSVLGGTAVNHVMLGHADAIFYSNGIGGVATPPSSVVANPNPAAGTINQYTTDGNFTNCSDTTRPEIQAIRSYLSGLSYKPAPNCATNAYYMINNVNPGYLPNGAPANLAGNASPGTGFVPPSSVKSIGDALSAKKISWTYYGGSYNDAVALSNYAVTNNVTLTAAALANPAIALGTAYCQICNPFQYDTSTMANSATRQAHVQDTVDLIAAIQNDALPSVSFGKPDGLLDGHPQSSKIDLFEAYVQNLLDALDANPDLKASTAVIITWDEAGGYWDSGFVQPVDFFGDGPRIPALILSAYSTGGQVYHNYSDHVSIVKFIERNWGLDPLTARSRDNLPNPTAKADNPYIPTNMPALDDLWDAFDFTKKNNQPYFE